MNAVYATTNQFPRSEPLTIAPYNPSSVMQLARFQGSSTPLPLPRLITGSSINSQWPVWKQHEKPWPKAKL